MTKNSTVIYYIIYINIYGEYSHLTKYKHFKRYKFFVESLSLCHRLQMWRTLTTHTEYEMKMKTIANESK